jgi:peroxiredoxin
MPEFSLLQKKYAAKNIKFVGIALDSADKVADYSRQSPVAYPLLIANEAPMSIIRGLGNVPGGLPFTVIIDRDGKLYRSWLGIWKSDLLEPVLAELPQTASD